jgi:hypothetical protein
MATGFLSPIGVGQWFNDQGVVLAGGKINTYVAGTTTPAPTYTTPTLSVPNPNPIVLDSAGRAPQEIWLQQGVAYKFVVTDKSGNALSNGTYDNLSGVNDTSNQNSVSEWIISGSSPTYVSGTQFTVAGNQTGTFTVGRRIYASVSAGTVYGTITASSFSSPNTTVTIAVDSGALDSGLTAVAYALFDPTHPSLATLNGLKLNEPGQGVQTLTINAAGDTSYGAVIALMGDGATTPNKYIRSHGGVFGIVNNAYTTQLLALDDSGNLTVTGNITGQSDERLKADWAPLPADFIERLAGVKSGTYTRVDIEDDKRHAGVGAQSLQQVIPEAVLEGAQGMLSVAYGQAALVACVELAKEVMRLRALLEPVK